jgi:hypothetical protein
MAYALVGTIGVVSSGTSFTPTWGTGETRTADNLLICFASIPSSQFPPTTPSGWLIAKQLAGTSCNATIYYRIATGGDAGPIISSTIATFAQLAEFSGNATSSPLDQSGSAAGTSSPLTATNSAIDTASAELIVMAGVDFRSTARSPNDTWTSNNATIVQAGNNNAVSSTNHYSFGYSLATTSNAAADTAIMTCSVTTSITGLAIVAATFRLLPPPVVVLPELITQPMTPPQRR